MDVLTILTWVSIATGGLLILMMLLSLIGGLDIDIDIGDTETDIDSGSLGLIKGLLVFVSVGSWIIKIMWVTASHPAIAVTVGLVSGVAAFLFLNYLFRILLRNETNVNWSIDDALYQRGKVYLKIPGEGGSGIVHVDIRGAMRELKAKAMNNDEIKTGENISVVDRTGDYVIVKVLS